VYQQSVDRQKIIEKGLVFKQKNASFLASQPYLTKNCRSPMILLLLTIDGKYVIL